MGCARTHGPHLDVGRSYVVMRLFRHRVVGVFCVALGYRLAMLDYGYDGVRCDTIYTRLKELHLQLE